MNIYTLCATERGCRFLEHLLELVPDAAHVVFTFPESAHEPPFSARLETMAADAVAEFHRTRDVGAAEFAPLWEARPPDLMFVLCWRYLIPVTLADRARRGCLVFHDSLLPRYRGFAPTPWAIINGETETGASLFFLSADVDAGDLVDQRPVPIGPDDTIAEVMGRVTDAYLELLASNLPRLLDGTAPRRPQDHAHATYTCRRRPEDNEIDWSAPTRAIHDLIRASTHPYPGAFTWLEGEKLTVWSARPDPSGRRYVGRLPGRVAEMRPGVGTTVLTGDGALLLETVQVNGGDPGRADRIVDRLSLRLSNRPC